LGSRKIKALIETKKETQSTSDTKRHRPRLSEGEEEGEGQNSYHYNKTSEIIER